MQVGGSKFQDEAFERNYGGDANYNGDDNYEIVHLDFGSKNLQPQQFDSEVNASESYSRVHPRAIPSTQASEFSTVSELTHHSIPPPSPLSPKTAKDNIGNMTREELLRYIGLSSSHLPRSALLEQALAKKQKMTPGKLFHPTSNSVNSTDRTNTSSAALYNIDPALLQTFADALTPDKTKEIKRLRQKLETATSALQSLRSEVLALRAANMELENIKSKLEVDNKQLTDRLVEKSNALHDFTNHKADMEKYLSSHSEFFNTIQTTVKGLFLHETLYQETANNLAEETEHRQRLEGEVAESAHELKEVRKKMKSQEKIIELQKAELESLRTDIAQNKQLLKDYDNVTELSRMKNELRKMKEKSMNLKNMQNILQNQRIKFFELQKDYKDLEMQHDRLKDLLAETNSKNDELRIKLLREKDSRDRRNQSAQRSERKVGSAYPENQLKKQESMATDQNIVTSGMKDDLNQTPPRNATKRDPKDTTVESQRTKKIVYLQERMKQIERFSLMKKNGVPLNKEQEALVSSEGELRMQLASLQNIS